MCGIPRFFENLFNKLAGRGPGCGDFYADNVGSVGAGRARSFPPALSRTHACTTVLLPTLASSSLTSSSQRSPVSWHLGRGVQLHMPVMMQRRRGQVVG